MRVSTLGKSLLKLRFDKKDMAAPIGSILSAALSWQQNLIFNPENMKHTA
jgi:hypothetical protein